MSDQLNDNPFDPASNPNIEFVPYDEDPSILFATSQGDQTARELHARVGAWQAALHELSIQSDSEAAKASLEYAKTNLEEYLAFTGIGRAIREKHPHPEES